MDDKDKINSEEEETDEDIEPDKKEESAEHKRASTRSCLEILKP